MQDEYNAFDISAYEEACQRRGQWDNLWQDCYDYALPQRGNMTAGLRRGERLYDGTTLDCVDQLASLLLGNLTPPMSSWFGLKAGVDLSAEETRKLAPLLEKSSRILQTHFDHSNFIVEFHQSLLDLIVAGTASLAFEENEPGDMSAFRFTAVPIQDILLGEGYDGRLDVVYRPLSLTLPKLLVRYPDISWPLDMLHKGTKDQQAIFDVIESCVPDHTTKTYLFSVFCVSTQTIVFEKTLSASPFINFRWMKSPGEIYGRSPVMKTLPDIKTANKVVELILKNASISATGIWQAEDDGVLNLATIELVPGAIIPKAVGSKGLTPLEMPARFDVSQLVLDDLRARIRHALLADRLPQGNDKARTATEIMERSAEMSLLLGATFGRLQVELLNPLIKRAYHILRQRGAIPDLPLDGRTVMIDYRSPLAKAQSNRDAQAAIGWIQTINALGEEASNRIDRVAVMDYLSNILGLSNFLKTESPPTLNQTSKTLGDIND